MNNANKLHEIRTRTITGTAQLISRELVIKIVAIAGQLLLVRLLSPSSFGIFAILSFILSTAEIFTDIGLSFTIIQQKKKPSSTQVSTIFFIKFFLAVLVVCFIYIISPLFLSIYHQFTETEVIMLRVFSLTILLKPFQSVIVSMLERDLRYKDIAIIDISEMLSYYITALLLAFFRFGTWSFIWAAITMTVIENIVTFIMYPWLPKLSCDVVRVKSMIEKGKYFQAGFFLTIIHNAIIPVLGGSKLSLAAVGYLDWSFNVASFPRVFVDNLSRVSFASFSRVQDDRTLIATTVEQSMKMLNVIGIFVIASILIFGHESTHYLLGDKWLPALPALYWYVGSLYFSNGTGMLGHALLAVGKIKRFILAGFLAILFEVISSFFLLTKFGFTGISIGFFFTNVLLFVLYLWLCNRQEIFIRIRHTFIENMLLLSLTVGFSYLFNIMIPSSLLFLLIKLFLSGCVYLFFLFILMPDSLKLTLKLIQKRGK